MSFPSEYYSIPSSVPDFDDLRLDILLSLKSALEKNEGKPYKRSSFFDQFPKEVQDEIIRLENLKK